MLKGKIKKGSKAVLSLALIAALVGTIAPINKVSGAVEANAAVSDTTKYRNVMYYGDWSVWDGQKNCMPWEMPVDKYTHLNYAFLDFNSSGELQWTDPDSATKHGLKQDKNGVTYGDLNAGLTNAFQVLKQKNPNLKIGISLGGWSKSGDFTAVCKNPSTRAKFIQNVCDFIRYTNMDFVDIDWEYPTAKRDPDLCDNRRDEGTTQGCPEDKEYFVQLLQDFRTALDKQGKELGKKYELTAALPAPIKKVQDGIDVKRVFEILDFANIMTYDMRGAWDDNAGHQSGLYTNPNDPNADSGLSVDESVKYYMSQGAPSNKIVIGACYYTRGWEKVSSEGTDPKTPGLFGAAAQCTKDADNTPSYGAWPEAPLKDGEGGRMTGTWSYNSMDALKQKYPGLKEYWDDVAKAPYLYAENGAFFTYDNARSIQEKCKYVKENNLGGMITWMASQDAPTESGKRDELTNAMYSALYGDAKLPEYYVSDEPLDLSYTYSLGKAQFGTGGTLTITITNNAKCSAQGEVLNWLETAYKSIKNAKLYIETDGFQITGRSYPTPELKEENGFYVLDLGGLFQDKIWSPGSSKTYTLTTDRELTDISGITQMFMTQRMYLDSPEYSKKILIGSSSEEQIKDSNGNFLPTIQGIRNKKITVGDAFDPLEGIKAYDIEDGDLTNKIKVSGNVNNLKKGTYELTYSVTDSKGAKREAKAVITVKNKTFIPEDNFDSTHLYNQGDIVVYQGRYWEYIWNIASSTIPGTNPNIWKDNGPAEVEIEEDIIDLATIASKYNKRKGDVAYSSECDLNNDDIIDIYDLVIKAKTM